MLGSFFTVWGPNGLFFWLESTHVVEQLSFPMFLTILTFNLDLISGQCLTFWGPNGLSLGLRRGSKTVLGSTQVVEQLSFSLFLSFLTLDFLLNFGVIFDFLGT